MDYKLNPNWTKKEELDQKPIRNGFGEALVEAAIEDERIVGLSADLTESTRMHWFAEQFPKRFVQMGIAEQNMAGVAAGLAISGKIPFASSYAVFSPGRNWDQIRVSICYSKANVKIVSSHSGLSVGPDGATHQGMEDIAITRVLPNMSVVVPCDYIQAKKATRAIAGIDSPTYLRLCKSDTPVFTTDETPFEFGKAQIFYGGSDVSIFATGTMVFEAMLAAEALSKEGVSSEVVNLHTIKPLDVEAIIESAKKTGAVVTAEEHQKAGGMGSAVVETLAQNNPVPVEMVGINDTFAESGNPEELFEKYGITSNDIVSAVRKVITRK